MLHRSSDGIPERIGSLLRRAWVTIKRNPPIPIIFILCVVAVAAALWPWHSQSIVTVAPTSNLSDTQVIGDAVGEKFTPRFVALTNALNAAATRLKGHDALLEALGNKQQEHGKRLGAVEGTVKQIGQTLQTIGGDIKLLQERKIDKDQLEQILEQHLKQVPDLVSEMKSLRKEVQGVGFQKRSAS